MYTFTGGSIGFLPDFEFYVVVLGLRRGLIIRFLAPWRFKILDSQPGKSNMGSVPTHFHDFRHSHKSCRGIVARYLSCFGTCRRKIVFLSFPVGTKKNHDEKLCRFVVVSPREVPSLPVSCPFKIFTFLSCLKAPMIQSQAPRESVH